MKVLRDYRVYVKLHNQETWNDTSWFENIVYQELEEDLKITLPTVEKVEELKKYLRSCEIKNKIFGGKKIVLRDCLGTMVSADNKKLRKCGGFDILFCYEEVNNLSIKEVANLLTAEEFIEYVKDRGLRG